jgi:hypothetical protein
MEVEMRCGYACFAVFSGGDRVFAGFSRIVFGLGA